MIEPSAKNYRWGRFQGWASLVFGAVVYVLALFVHSGISRFQMYVVGALHMAAGVGLLRKTRYGFVLLYVQAVLAGLRAVTTTYPPSIDEFITRWGLFCWWALPALFYYPKRYREFGFRKRVEAEPVAQVGQPQVEQVQLEKPAADYQEPMRRELTEEERAAVLEHMRQRRESKQ